MAKFPGGKQDSPSNPQMGKKLNQESSASLGGGRGKPFVPKSTPVPKSGK